MNEGGRGVGREPGASDEGRLDELKFRCLSVDAMVKSPEIPTDQKYGSYYCRNGLYFLCCKATLLEIGFEMELKNENGTWKLESI